MVAVGAKAGGEDGERQPLPLPDADEVGANLGDAASANSTTDCAIMRR